MFTAIGGLVGALLAMAFGHLLRRQVSATFGLLLYAVGVVSLAAFQFSAGMAVGSDFGQLSQRLPNLGGQIVYWEFWQAGSAALGYTGLVGCLLMLFASRRAPPRRQAEPAERTQLGNGEPPEREPRLNRPD